jgi:hypothetical protein
MFSNVKNKEARFVHPSEFGFTYPIHTAEEMYYMTSALNKGLMKQNGIDWSPQGYKFAKTAQESQK